MRILYYDCFSGISGDMNLGAMLDLGVEAGFLTGELSKLGLDGEFSLQIEKGTKNGIAGTKVNVALTHPHPAAHDAVPHGEKSGGHARKEDHRHPSRNLEDIRRIIDASTLSDRVKQSSMAMFLRIASAEAKVHGKPVDEVHFHEVGAVDSIVDMVGAAIAFDVLKADRILCSPVQVGGGFVKCAHGMIPVPGPATVEILQGAPLRFGAVPFETTTPTGAAILAANVDAFTEKTEFTIEKIGYGLGNRDLDIPNVLRVYLGTAGNTEGTDPFEEAGSPSDLILRRDQFVIETNIDDMNPEIYPFVEERLFEAGALDVYMTPIIMKKGRPAVKLSILADPATEKAVLDILFQETTTIGIRKFGVEKRMLHRNTETVQTIYGPIDVKCAGWAGAPVRYKAEFERCKAIAKQRHIPIAEVYRAVDSAMAKTGATCDSKKNQKE
jgi:uncharacterized protein (TIGR00299 family) protein